MSAATAVPRPASALRRLPAVDGAAMAAWLCGFVPVLYLLLRGGGYDLVIRGEAGVAIWWVLLLGAAIGALPLARVRPIAAVALGLLVAVAAWTAIGISWSSSSERGLVEVGRLATYVGIMALAIAAQARGRARAVLNGVGVAIAVVGALAVLSRLHPAWFPREQVGAFLPVVARRLSWPLNYWNALAATMAVGSPLLVTMAATGRTLVGRAAAAAALPMVALCGYLTFSRGGLAAGAVGLVAVLVLGRNRLALLVSALIGAGGAALLIAGVEQRGVLDHPLVGAAARSHGDRFVLNVLAVAAGVALLQAGVVLLHRALPAPRWRRPGRTTVAIAVAALVALALVASIAADAPGRLDRAWRDFKRPGVAQVGPSRFAVASGHGRYQVWRSALDAFEAHPLDGIGPGTFELWWNAHASLPVHIRNAHSLPLETAAELGVPGLVLMLAFLVVVLVGGGVRSLRGPPALRATTGAATAGCLAFVVAACVDWDWQLAGVAAAFLVLAAVALNAAPAAEAAEGVPVTHRVALIVAALMAIPAIGIGLATAEQVRQSQAAVTGRHLLTGLDRARTAEGVQSGAWSPTLQRALVLEQARDYRHAAALAQAAVAKSPRDWRGWAVLSRLELEAGSAPRALLAYRRARALNPRSPLFKPPTR